MKQICIHSYTCIPGCLGHQSVLYTTYTLPHCQILTQSFSCPLFASQSVTSVLFKYQLSSVILPFRLQTPLHPGQMEILVQVSTCSISAPTSVLYLKDPVLLLPSMDSTIGNVVHARNKK